MTPGFTFYAEYEGPKDVADAEQVVIRTDDVTHHVTHGRDVFVDGTVPPQAPLGTYALTIFEQRLKFGKTVRTRSLPTAEMPPEYRSITLIKAEPATSADIPWPTIKKPGAR